MTKPCVDCVALGVTTRRPIHPDSGPRKPRCATHQRAWKKRSQANAHARRLVGWYEMTPEQYAAIYRFQKGHCAICEISTGATRRLAVDHDHKLCDDHPPERGCPNCWRGLLCKRCNQLVGWYGVEALTRAVYYLTDPPSRKVLR